MAARNGNLYSRTKWRSRKLSHVIDACQRPTETPSLFVLVSLNQPQRVATRVKVYIEPG